MQLGFETSLLEPNTIPHEQAARFIEQWHYSATMPTGLNIPFGWPATNGGLYAVAVYGIGVNPFQYQYLSKITGLNITINNLLEIKRLARIEPRNESRPLSAFLSRCHRMLRDRGFRHIVAYSDPEHGHSGGIYKASNFTYLGKTNPESHTIGQGGQVRHRRFAYRYARRHGMTIDEARKRLGLNIVKTLPKDRWFIAI